MARKPNYSFERQERERAEAKKAEAKAAAKAAKRAAKAAGCGCSRKVDFMEPWTARSILEECWIAPCRAD